MMVKMVRTGERESQLGAKSGFSAIHKASVSFEVLSFYHERGLMAIAPPLMLGLKEVKVGR